MNWEVLEQYQTFGFALVNLDNGVILNCTTAFASIVGRDRHRTIGQTMIELTPPEFRQQELDRLAAARKGDHDRFAVEQAYLLPSGQKVWCHLETVRADQDHLLSAISRRDQNGICSEVQRARRERDEIAERLDIVHEKMYALMVAFAQRDNAIDVNLISGGQNNIGRNQIDGSQSQP